MVDKLQPDNTVMINGQPVPVQSFGAPPSTLEDYASRGTQADYGYGSDYITTNPDAPPRSTDPAGDYSVPDPELEVNIQDDPIQYIKDTAGKPWKDLDPAGIFGARATKNAAELATNAERRAIAEQGRQFDITQEQYRPYQEAGARGLAQYEDLANRRGEFGVESNLPGAYTSSMDIPEFDFQSGEYGLGQGNVPGGFQFGADEFEQYKDLGYDFEVEESLRGLDRKLASRGKRRSGLRGRALMELGQDLASGEFGRARGRARQDYDAQVGRERESYQRGLGDYGRRTGREAELYGRGRNLYGDQLGQEQTLSDRDYMDYTSRVGREEGAYNRSLEQYARDYVDPMSRYGQLAGQGQASTLGLAGLRSNYAQNIGDSASRVGGIQAAAGLGQAKIYGQVANQVGSYFNQPPNTSTYTGRHDVWGEPIG